MKVAINKCFGGFDMSAALCEKLIELGIPLYSKWEDIPKGNKDPYIVKDSEKLSFNDYYSNFNEYQFRTNETLIKAIEAIGEGAASGRFGNIKVVNIPDGMEYEIDDYDGIETIREKHRSW